MDAKFKQAGNVILNFESEHQKHEATAKVEKLENLSVNKTKMLFPKIMICNVSKEENKEDIMQAIIKRKDYMEPINNIPEKISLTFVKEATRDTSHINLKCRPEAKQIIHREGDAIKLEWSVHKVRDRHLLQCVIIVLTVESVLGITL